MLHVSRSAALLTTDKDSEWRLTNTEVANIRKPLPNVTMTCVGSIADLSLFQSDPSCLVCLGTTPIPLPRKVLQVPECYKTGTAHTCITSRKGGSCSDDSVFMSTREKKMFTPPTHQPSQSANTSNVTRDLRAWSAISADDSLLLDPTSNSRSHCRTPRQSNRSLPIILTSQVNMLIFKII